MAERVELLHPKNKNPVFSQFTIRFDDPKFIAPKIDKFNEFEKVIFCKKYIINQK